MTIAVHGERNCNKFLERFELLVYLDIFHAVKRFSDKVPKRHLLCHECLRDWRMVFRDPIDQGDKRTLSTPSPEVLEGNLNQFLHHWKETAYDGKKLINAAALKEIENIRAHIKRGCLSGIKPGRGTNRNENLHKDLNKIMSNSRYGVELAYSLLTVVLYNHNERMAALFEKCMERPILHYRELPVHNLSERFGLRFVQDPSSSAFNPNSKDTFKKLDIASSTYTQLYHRILDTPIPDVGHSKQGNTYVEDETITSITADSTLDNDIEMKETCRISILKDILMQSLSWFFIHKSIQGVSETAHIFLDQIPFMTSTSSDLSNSIMDMTQEGRLGTLDNLLKSWNLERHEIPKDGNCLFSSVAFNLQAQIKRGNTDLKAILDGLNINIKDSLSQVASNLRVCVVEEWIGQVSIPGFTRDF